MVPLKATFPDSGNQSYALTNKAETRIEAVVVDLRESERDWLVSL